MNFPKFLEKYNAVRQAQGAIDHLIQDAELLYPGRGAGPQKLEYVRQQFALLFAGADKVVGTVAELWEIAKPIIAIVVAFRNKTGWAPASDGAPAAPAAAFATVTAASDDPPPSVKVAPAVKRRR